MQLGMIGLGRMGSNMVLRLLRAGHQCVAYDRNVETTQNFDKSEKNKAEKGSSVADLVKQLKPPRAVWVMLPAGKITEDCVNELAGLLQSGDTIIDGGNTMFKDDVRRAAAIKSKGLTYMDVGTSGGIWGIERGYCQMIGGDKAAFDRLEPIFAALAPGGTGSTPAEKGYLHCGPAGAGHFVKMIHNGIEYGMMQAFAEGFEILEKAASDKVPAERRYNLDLHKIALVWRQGSVVSSWLLDLLEAELEENPKLDNFRSRTERESQARQLPRLCARFRRGQMDDRGGHRGRRAGRRADDFAFCPIPFAAAPGVWRPGVVGHAEGVRRPQGGPGRGQGRRPGVDRRLE
jgi:6-phosphogluconate dehydrogenase